MKSSNVDCSTNWLKKTTWSGHGFDHRLDALARREETERKNDLLVVEAEFRFGLLRFNEGQIRYSVRYHLDVARRNVMNEAQEFVTLFRHDDDLGRRIDDPAHHVTLGGIGLRKDGVKRGHDRHFEA